jgi:post-segregation antitoxin (ccd killing protein)
MRDSEHTMMRTTISVPRELLLDAKTMAINVSQLTQDVLQREVAKLKARQWAIENAVAIDEYNKDIRENGLLLEEQGPW